LFSVDLWLTVKQAMGATTGRSVGGSGFPQNLDGPPNFLHSFSMNRVLLLFSVDLCLTVKQAMGATTGRSVGGSGPPQNLDEPPKFLHSFSMNRV